MTGKAAVVLVVLAVQFFASSCGPKEEPIEHSENRWCTGMLHSDRIKCEKCMKDEDGCAELSDHGKSKYVHNMNKINSEGRKSVLDGFKPNIQNSPLKWGTQE